MKSGDASNTMLRAYISHLYNLIVVRQLNHGCINIIFYAILLIIFHHGTSEKVEVVAYLGMVKPMVRV